MDSQPQTFRIYLPSALTLFFVGWIGLFLVLFFSLPYVWSRWAFYLLGIMALTGTALPVVYFLHKRFPGKQLVTPNVIVRQAVWVGVYGATLAWLQLGKLVTLPVMLGLAGSFIAAEYFIRIREQANRQLPFLPDDDDAS